ncbi:MULTISPECIES: hypothetical protein [unclassified Treponema]|uniref:hypothetical protein n=1 Tax=unclassified Treponema TaxID=2638727 RepID=UPI0020A45A8D|nr:MULTISPECIES: hypothetical protein [unclassified Treponema]UTC67928.1 hypothetical protein E4O06_04580 [Treponema sp. OMZ 789]UTC70649.1 hypothetical protein E4O01_04570 [Treponema sp. OMZ 790]UTC73373.1 hypothetical protein E4O02_04815 [Treponema sp. OMZ 791]
MKKYIFIFTVISLIFLNIYSEDTETSSDYLTEQTETMLNEIRIRNGIDYFTDSFENEENETEEDIKEEEPESTETLIENEDKTIETEKPPKEPFLKTGRQSFALGIEFKAGASNSYFRFKDLFKKTLEIDLSQMSNTLPKAGFGISTAADANIYLNIYIKSKIEFGIFVKAEAYTFSNIPKNIIDLAAKGNLSSNNFKGKILGNSQTFASTGIFYGMSFNSFKFRLSTSYFVPGFYMESDIGDYEFLTDSITGRLVLKGKLKLNMYSHIPIFGNPKSKLDIKDILSKGGVDFSFYGTYKFNELANINFNLINIPLFPAHLNKGFSKTFEGDFKIESIIQYLNNFITPDKASKIKPPGGSFTETPIVYDLPEKKIFRPLKLSVSSDIRPFSNDYLIITPSIGCHCFRPFYVDAGLKIESRFLKVLGTYLSMNYEDRVWKNGAGFFLETRIFRVETAVSLTSPSFTESFKAAGAEAAVKLVFGY